MSLDIWPPISAAELKLKESETQEEDRMLIKLKERELRWATSETIKVCDDLKHGLEDCYALLAPIDPGSTLVMSTPRNEKVKGTITRVGTRIVKGTLNLKLHTLPPQTISLSQSHAVHIHALDELHTHLTQSIDLLSVTLSEQSPPDPASLAQTLGLLAESLSTSAALLKGPPLASSDLSWQTSSCPPDQFSPQLGPNVSFHMGLQDSCVVLTLRALEPVHAPVHLGTKLGLAIGTFRRLEHDEMDMVFRYNPAGCENADLRRSSARHSPEPRPSSQRSEQQGQQHDQSALEMEEVYVREKVRVESADPSLISLYSKLGFLSHMLGQARRNLAAVIGSDLED